MSFSNDWWDNYFLNKLMTHLVHKMSEQWNIHGVIFDSQRTDIHKIQHSPRIFGYMIIYDNM